MVDQAQGKRLMSWGIPEIDHYERSRRWYIVAGVIAVALVVFALFIGDGGRANPLFALIIILGAVIVFARHMIGVEMVDFAIHEDGIALGRQFFPYREMTNFYIIYQPPTVKRLYIMFRSVSQPRISVPLNDVNPVKVREALLDYLDEDLEKEQEALTDSLSRTLKL